MENELLKEIERLREEMVKMSDELGINHPLILKLSQKIDLLHVQLTREQMELRYKQKKLRGDSILEKSLHAENYHVTRHRTVIA